MQYPRFCIYLRFSFLPSGVTVCAQHMKFDAEADFDVRAAVAPPKPHQIDEKLIFPSENFVFLFFSFGVEKSKVANRPKRALLEFHADRMSNRSNQSTGRSTRSKATMLAHLIGRIDREELN